MADFIADFEAGTHGNTITTAAGEASPAWNEIGATPTYDNTRVARGALAAKFNDTNEYCQWTMSTSDHYGRAYLYLQANPSDTQMRFITTNAGNAAIYVHLDGTIKLESASGTVFSTNVVALNQWIRIEYHIIHSTTTGQIQAKLFNSVEDVIPTETVTSPATWNTAASATQIFFGLVPGQGGGYTIWMDSIIANATAYPGPALALTFLPFQPHLRW